jgi:hypothetical protein
MKRNLRTDKFISALPSTCASRNGRTQQHMGLLPLFQQQYTFLSCVDGRPACKGSRGVLKFCAEKEWSSSVVGDFWKISEGQNIESL